MKTLTVLQVCLVFLTVYISSVELHSTESGPKGKRCLDSCQCPNGTACLPVGNGSGVSKHLLKRRCQLCKCRSNTQCIKRFNEVLCDCSNSGYTGTFCETEIETTSDLCPANWLKYENSCYLYVPDSVNWETAYSDCLSKDAYLVEITSEAEQYFVETVIAQDFWIGLTDINTEGEFVWTYSNQPATFFPNPFYYNSPEDDCVHIFESISWETNLCTNSYRYVCEKTL